MIAPLNVAWQEIPTGIRVEYPSRNPSSLSVVVLGYITSMRRRYQDIFEKHSFDFFTFISYKWFHHTTMKKADPGRRPEAAFHRIRMQIYLSNSMRLLAVNSPAVNR